MEECLICELVAALLAEEALSLWSALLQLELARPGSWELGFGELVFFCAFVSFVFLCPSIYPVFGPTLKTSQTGQWPVLWVLLKDWCPRLCSIATIWTFHLWSLELKASILATPTKFGAFVLERLERCKKPCQVSVILGESAINKKTAIWETKKTKQKRIAKIIEYKLWDSTNNMNHLKIATTRQTWPSPCDSWREHNIWGWPRF